jgi:DNA-directed RNA polymerase subunit omega
VARVTVEDCIKKINNQFELVLVAAQRTRELSAGAEITIPKNNDKMPVIALREIALETIDIKTLRNNLVQNPKYAVHEDVLDDNPQEDFLIGKEDVMREEMLKAAQHDEFDMNDDINEEIED